MRSTRQRKKNEIIMPAMRMIEEENIGVINDFDQKTENKKRKTKLMVGGFCLIGFVNFIIITTVCILRKQQLPPKPTIYYDGFRVIPSDEVICFNSSDPESYQNYTRILDNFIEPYTTMERGGNVINCRDEEPTGNQTCHIRDNMFYPCLKSMIWGYDRLKPCVILTFMNNTQPPFMPTPFKSLKEMGSNIPRGFKHNIEEEIEEYEKFKDNLVRIYCTDMTNNDYRAEQGFLAPIFKTVNNPGYLPPIVTVSFDLTSKEQIYTECTIWVKNIEPNKIVKRKIRIRKNGYCSI